MKYKITLPAMVISKGISPRILWCEEYIGKQGIRWIIIGESHEISHFLFEREEDLILFSLKWS